MFNDIDIDFDIMYDELYNENKNRLKESSTTLSEILEFFSDTKDKGRTREKYYNVFNENIIKPIIQRMFSDVVYDYKDKISELEYKLGDFERYDVFSSKLRLTKMYEDRLGIISYVTPQKRRYDEDSNYRYFPIFSGAYCMFKLKSKIKGNIYITDDKKIKKNVKVDLDMVEFEKYFDVSADDRLEAFRLLTSDVMHKLLDIRKNINKKIELKIKDDFVCFRISMPYFFEPNPYFQKEEKENIRKSIKLLNEIINLLDILDELKI